MEAGSPKHFCAAEKLHADWVFVELHGFRDACPVSPVMTETFGVAAKRLPTFVSSVVLLGFLVVEASGEVAHWKRIAVD